MEALAWWGFGVWSAPFLWVMLIILCESAFLIRCSAYESPGYGVLSLLVFFTAFYFMGIFNPISYLWHNIGWAALWIVGYALIGVSYARIIKWKMHLAKWASDNRSFKLEWLSRRNVTGMDVPDNLQNDWLREISQTNGTTRFDPENVWNYKRQFFTWVGYWPFSAFWTLINDPFKRFVDWAYHAMMASMQREADKAATQFNKDRELVKARFEAEKATSRANRFS